MNVPRTLSLTFDDGPDPLWTGLVLGALRRAEARATFFMVAERIRAAPRAAGAVLEAGHQVELHCDRHVRHSELSELELELDTRKGLATLAELGVRPNYWRTPWGVCTPATARVAQRNGLALAGWTIDTHDWRGDSAESMLASARQQLNEGSIVLMHDALGPGARRPGCQQTVELVTGLVALARGMGLDVQTLAAAQDAGETAIARVR